MTRSPALERARQIWIDLVPQREDVTIEEFRSMFSDMCESLGLAEDAQVDEVDAGGVPALWVKAPGASDDRVVLHLHSGGYVMGCARDYRDLGYRLSKAADARVLLVDYRLAPEHAYPAAMEDCHTAYRWVLSQGIDPGNIVISGDSAGGGLAATTLINIRDAGDPAPAAGVMMSPLTDLAATGESMTKNHEIDPLHPANLVPMMGGAYLGGRTPEDTPLASPINCDLSGLPPMLILVGSIEGLFDDAERLADRTREAGGDVEFFVGDDMVHIWPLFASFLPEGQDAVDRIGRFVREHTRQGATA